MKTVVITGTSSGLGLALTQAFLQAGWKVVAAGRHAPNVPPNPNLQVAQCDLADSQSVQAFLAALHDTPIDILINNAAVYDALPDQEAVTSNMDDIARIFQVNAVAPKILTDGLARNLEAGTDKLVVAMSSGMGTYAEFEEYHARHWPYSASKTALNYAMVSFAKLHPNIKVTLIDPGWMQTAIGGSDAPLKPEESAAAIFDLITQRADKLPNAEMVDYAGKRMSF